MFKRIAQPLGLLLLSWSSVLHALGLGEIEVQSQLNQPLRATIALPSATTAELETLVVKVAPNSAFDRAGIELAGYVSSLQFEVVREGTPSVRVTSTELAREPFLSFLIEARWAGGRILREYTVLLDPPNLAAASSPAEAPAQPAPAPAAPAAKPAAPVAKPAAPVINQPAEPVFYEEDPAAVPPATRRYSTERESAKSPVTPAVPAASATVPASTYGPVKRQETLWSIAFKLRPDPQSVTMDQMLIALFESNQEAFGGDINGLRTGTMLTVPPLLDIVAVDPVEAKRRVDMARKRGAAAPAKPVAKPRTVAPLAQKRPAPPPPPVELEREPELEPEPEPEPEPTAKPVAPTVAPRASAPDANSALAQLQAMAGQSSGQAPASELEPEPEPEPAYSEEPLSEADEEYEAELASEPEPEVEVVEPVATAPVVEEPASGGLPWMGIGLGLLILLLGGAGWVFYKRRGQAKEQAVPAAAAATSAEADASDEADEPSFEEVAAAAAVETEDEAEDTGAFDAVDGDDDELMDETQSLPDDLEAEPAEAAADEVDFDVTAQFQADTMQINLDANDPVSEADFHLAYGLYDEAALLLQQAQEREPGRQDIKVKLAETYFAGGKTDEFLDAARNLKGELPEAEWQKIAIMGSQIAAEDPLFQDAGEAAAEGVDLDFGGDEATPEAVPAEAAGEAPTVDSSADDDNSLSFDLELDDEPVAEPKAEAAAAPAADAPGGDDNSLEFDLGDFDLELDDADDGDTSKAEAPSSESLPPAESDSGIESLDLDSLDMGPSNELSDDSLSTGGRNEPSLDIGDFGLDELEAPAEPAAEPLADDATERKEPTLDDDQAAELDFADLGLNDDSAESGISDGDEASTKLDLARAYIDMGDNEMAKGLLDEVVAQGSDEQKAAAEELIQRLPGA